MATILNPTMTLSTTSDEVFITVGYTVRFGEHDRLTLPTGSPAHWFSEQIDVLGAKYALSFSPEPLTPQVQDMPRQRTQAFQREYFEKNVLPTVVWCRIRIAVTPPTGDEQKTNSAVIPSRAIVPFRPLSALRKAIAAVGAAIVVGAIASALVRRSRSVDPNPEP